MTPVAAAKYESDILADPYESALDRIRRGLRPKPFVLDPLVTAQVVYEGGLLYESENQEPAGLKTIVWRLLQEAVMCDRAIRRPGPKHKARSGPEVYYTPSEIFAVELEWVADNITYPPRVFETPTAKAFARYQEVMTWLRFVRCRNNKPLRIRMVLALASGMPPAKMLDVREFRPLNFGNPDAIWAAKNRAIINMADAIRGACKDLVIGD